MNTIRSLHRLLTLSVLTVTALCAHAQTAKPPVKPVSVRFHCLSMTPSSLEGLSFMNGKTEVPLSVPTEFLSPTYDYVGPAKLVFLRKVATPSAGAATAPSEYPPGREPVAVVDLSADNDELLLLFNQAGDKTAVAAIDYTEKSVPINGYLFWNLSTRPLMVSLGDSKCILPAGQRQVITLGEEDSYLPLRIFDVHMNQARQVFASRTLHHPKTRQLIFVADSVNDPDRVALRMVSQNYFQPKPTLAKSNGSLVSMTQ